MPDYVTAIGICLAYLSIRLLIRQRIRHAWSSATVKQPVDPTRRAIPVRKVYEIPPIDQQLFEQNLKITQAYCDHQLKNNDKSPAEILRSYNPDCNGQPLFSFKDEVSEWALDILTIENESTLEQYFYSSIDYKRKAMADATEKIDYEGKILKAEFITLIDGTSEPESGGFIDVYDLPPIDSWFYVNRNENNALVFYAWIPQEFVALVDFAIATNIVECFYWVDKHLQ